MRIFNRNNESAVNTMWDDDPEIIETVADFDSTLSYLIGLSAEEYKKVLKCADINRKSLNDQCKVLGVENVPTTFIDSPADDLQTVPTITKSNSFLDEDTELGSYLEGEQPIVHTDSITMSNKGKKKTK